MGYYKDKNDVKVKIDQEDAKTYRYIIDCLLLGEYSCHTLALHLNELGIKGKRGKPWDGGRIWAMVHSEVYLGKIKYNGDKMTGKRYGNRGIQEQIIVDNIDIAIQSHMFDLEASLNDDSSAYKAKQEFDIKKKLKALEKQLYKLDCQHFFCTIFIRSYYGFYTLLESYNLKNYEFAYCYTVKHNCAILI